MSYVHVALPAVVGGVLAPTMELLELTERAGPKVVIIVILFIVVIGRFSAQALFSLK